MAIHRLQSTRLRVSGAILMFVLTTAASARAQTNATWNGPSGNWTNAAIWSTNPLYPNNGNPGGSTYNAILTGNSSTITLDANITIEQLQFNTGTLAGTNTLTLNQLFTWGNGSADSGGTLFGAGTLNANGGASFNGASLMSILNGWTLNLNANSTWSNGNITVNGSVTQGSSLTIASGVTLTATGNNSVVQTAGFISSFTNLGTFRKMTGTGTTSIGGLLPFTNSGAVDVQTGTLLINGGGTNTGSFNVASGAILQFAAGPGADTFNINAGPGITGSGATTINMPTVNINVASYPIATALNLVAGTLGGTGTAQANGVFTFTGGTVSGMVNANGGGQFTGTDIKTVDNGGILNLNSASTWDNGTIRLNGGGTLSIASGATMSATGNNQIDRTGGAVSSFANAGTFRKMTGTGTTTIANTVPFTNTGAVDVQSGILSINGGGTSTGSFNVSSSATLQFGAGPGAGTFNINSGPGITGSGATTINTATVNVNAASYPIATALNLVAGTLGGTGTTQANGVLTFTGGIVSGAVNGNGGVLFTGSTGKFINTGGLLNVQSNSTWDAGNIMLNGGTLSIGSSATLTATGNDALTRTASGVGTFSNAGTFRKITGTGTTTVSFISFNNTGTVDLQTGTLALNSGLTNNGTFQVAAGATSTGIVTSSGSGSIVRGRGTVDTLVMNNLSTLSPGFSPGKLTATGNVTMNSGSTYFVELTSNVPDTGYDVLAVAGTVNLNNPTLSVSLNYAPAPSDVFTIITAGSIPSGNIFAGYANGALVPLGNGYTATIEYGSTFVRLVNPVPEATDILLVCSAATLAISFWRRFGLAG